MFGQVIAAGELLLADDALVWLDPRVGTAVAGELVRAGEPAGKGQTTSLVCLWVQLE